MAKKGANQRRHKYSALLQSPIALILSPYTVLDFDGQLKNKKIFTIFRKEYN
jgi:hypothetical protein